MCRKKTKQNKTTSCQAEMLLVHDCSSCLTAVKHLELPSHSCFPKLSTISLIGRITVRDHTNETEMSLLT